MNTAKPATIQILPEVLPRIKAAAKRSEMSIKRLTTLLLESALDQLESGEVRINPTTLTDARPFAASMAMRERPMKSRLVIGPALKEEGAL
jgi:hypothetical protein